MELIWYYRSFLESLNKSPHTIKQYCIDGEQFLTFVKNNNKTLESDMSEVIGDYIDYLMESYKAHSTINRKISSLKNFLYFLNSRGVVQHVPEDLLKPIKNNEMKIKTLKDGQLTKVIQFWLTMYEYTEEPEYKWLALRDFCIVRLIAELSLKPSELVAMKWSHIQGNVVTIRSRRRLRKLQISSPMMDWLYIYKKETKELFKNEVDSIWLGVGNKKNSPITVKTIERIFQFISKKLGFKVTATDIRYATINKEVMRQTDHQLDVYKQFGYARKSVLKDRINRFKMEEKIID